MGAFFTHHPPNFTRKISSAAAKSPSASIRAFLHSIIGESVFCLNSLTIFAEILTSPAMYNAAVDGREANKRVWTTGANPFVTARTERRKTMKPVVCIVFVILLVDNYV